MNQNGGGGLKKREPDSKSVSRLVHQLHETLWQQPGPHHSKRASKAACPPRSELLLVLLVALWPPCGVGEQDRTLLEASPKIASVFRLVSLKGHQKKDVPKKTPK